MLISIFIYFFTTRIYYQIINFLIFTENVHLYFYCQFNSNYYLAGTQRYVNISYFTAKYFYILPCYQL